MQALYQIILFLHILAGTIALISGGISFSVKKSRGWHTRSGSFFYFSMLFVGTSALLMCLLKFNPFLFIVGLFSLYMTITGYRSMKLRSMKTADINKKADWWIWGISLAGLISFLFLSRNITMGGLTPVLWVFSFILATMLLSDFRALRAPERLNKGKLLKKHISRMGGAYIATLTAFLVTNIQTEPAYIAWLLPTAVGTPAIIYFQFKFSPKKKKVAA